MWRPNPAQCSPWHLSKQAVCSLFLASGFWSKQPSALISPWHALTVQDDESARWQCRWHWSSHSIVDSHQPARVAILEWMFRWISLLYVALINSSHKLTLRFISQLIKFIRNQMSSACLYHLLCHSWKMDTYNASLSVAISLCQPQLGNLR